VARRTIRLTLAYEGSAYAGWQRQADSPTVQGAIEAALKRLTGQAVSLIGAGRTDAGVHALGQVAAFTTPAGLSDREFERALKAMLPKDIEVIEAREAAAGFHPRYQALSKTYRYHLWTKPRPPLFARRYLWAVGRELDAGRMAEGLKVIEGSHDFAAFMSAGSEVSDTRRKIMRAELETKGRLWTFIFEADGFLRHMVRALVGTLVGGSDPEQLARILASGQRSQAGRTAPAQGLFLVHVRYPGQEEPLNGPGPFDPLEDKERS